MIDALQDLQTELEVSRDNEAYLLEQQAAINAAHQREVDALKAALKEAVDEIQQRIQESEERIKWQEEFLDEKHDPALELALVRERHLQHGYRIALSCIIRASAE